MYSKDKFIIVTIIFIAKIRFLCAVLGKYTVFLEMLLVAPRPRRLGRVARTTGNPPPPLAVHTFSLKYMLCLTAAVNCNSRRLGKRSVLQNLGVTRSKNLRDG